MSDIKRIISGYPKLDCGTMSQELYNRVWKSNNSTVESTRTLIESGCLVATSKTSISNIKPPLLEVFLTDEGLRVAERYSLPRANGGAPLKMLTDDTPSPVKTYSAPHEVSGEHELETVTDWDERLAILEIPLKDRQPFNEEVET